MIDDSTPDCSSPAIAPPCQPKCLRTAILCYLLTITLVVTGFAAGLCFLHPRSQQFCSSRQEFSREFREVFVRWDGAWYRGIITKGYRYKPEKHSPVAFFPAYPQLAALLWRTTGIPADISLVLVSNACLVASYAVFCRHARKRYAHDANRLATMSLLALAVFPAAMFMCMAYGESLFLLLCILVSYGIQCRWRLIIIALLVGAATAARAVGVALIVPLILDAWVRSRSPWRAVLTCAYLIPISCWGIAAYMAFQMIAFGNPLAFVQTQEFWSLRPPVSGGDKVLALASLEPVWSLYDPGSVGYWRRLEGDRCALFSLHAANPVYVFLAAVLVCIGARKSWLSKYEVSLAVGLLVIPYVTRGFEMCMASQARFASVVFPIYLVLGHLLCRVPRWVAVGVLALSSAFLVIYAAGMAGGYRTF